ncbi:MAG: GTPase Era [Candidatus Omnitrophica bacterium]|nr:GTPase Era [Candidatus Omnitrophota bacterium]
MKPVPFKSGYVAVLGKPNVGKSTLLNFFLKEKLSIVSSKPQTTRSNFLGILTTAHYQIIFIDTPGLHKPKTLLGRYMTAQARQAVKDADEIIVIVDAANGIRDEDLRLFDYLRSQIQGSAGRSSQVLVLINKTDLVSQKSILPLVELCRKNFPAAQYMPVSAKTGANMELVLKKIVEFLSPGPAYYPRQQLSDENERDIAAELIREKVLEFCRHEVPHAVAVELIEFKDNPPRKVLICANIFVEKKSQKKIIIGKEAQMLKKIGRAARLELERFLGREVYLELWVKVGPNWRQDKNFLRRLGYDNN